MLVAASPNGLSKAITQGDIRDIPVQALVGKVASEVQKILPNFPGLATVLILLNVLALRSSNSRGLTVWRKSAVQIVEQSIQ